MDIWGWMNNLVLQYGYFGAFMISLFGNFTIFFPVPFAVTIYACGASLNPLILGLVAAIGSTIGEFSAYLVGRGGRKLLEDKHGKKLEGAKLLIERYGMTVIFLFALLPLPDDVILIPLGVMNYDLRKALIAAFLGKLGMCLSLAYAGRYSFEAVRNVFQSSGITGGIASVVLLVILMIVIIKVDWTKFIKVEENV